MKKYQYGTCGVCGKQNTRIYKLYGYTVCAKHMHQIFSYGEPQDTNPRTVQDLNDFVWRDDGYAEMIIYNQKCEEVARTIIDPDIVDKIRYQKWSINNHGYVYHNYPNTQLHRIIAGAEKDQDVDHINGNLLDNRRCNLRVCTISENCANKHYSSRNTSGFIGVPPSSRGGWAPEIRFNNIRVHLGRYRILEEAVYARYVAEVTCFKEFQNKEQAQKAEALCENLPAHRKKEIEEYVLNKLHKYFGSELLRNSEHAA